NMLHERPPRTDMAVKNATAILQSGIETALRCMDEYAARGTFSLYTKEVETGLLGLADVEASRSTPNPVPTVVPDPDPEPEAQAPSEVIGASEITSGINGMHRDYPDGVDGVLMEL